MFFRRQCGNGWKRGYRMEQCLGIAPDEAFRPMQADKIRRRNEWLIEAARALPPSSRPWVGLATEIKAHNRRWSRLRKLQEMPEAEWRHRARIYFPARIKIDPDKPLPATSKPAPKF
jgi:hypothetical protein